MTKIKDCYCRYSWPHLDMRRGRYRIICRYCGFVAAPAADINGAIENWNEEVTRIVDIFG